MTGHGLRMDCHPLVAVHSAGTEIHQAAESNSAAFCFFAVKWAYIYSARELLLIF